MDGNTKVVLRHGCSGAWVPQMQGSEWRSTSLGTTTEAPPPIPPATRRMRASASISSLQSPGPAPALAAPPAVPGSGLPPPPQEAGAPQAEGDWGAPLPAMPPACPSSCSVMPVRGVLMLRRSSRAPVCHGLILPSAPDAEAVRGSTAPGRAACGESCSACCWCGGVGSTAAPAAVACRTNGEGGSGPADGMSSDTLRPMAGCNSAALLMLMLLPSLS